MFRFSGDAIENRDIGKFILWALFWTGVVVWGLTLQGCGKHIGDIRECNCSSTSCNRPLPGEPTQ
jgi:hypothetical protein